MPSRWPEPRNHHPSRRLSPDGSVGAPFRSPALATSLPSTLEAGAALLGAVAARTPLADDHWAPVQSPIAEAPCSRARCESAAPVSAAAVAHAAVHPEPREAKARAARFRLERRAAQPAAAHGTPRGRRCRHGVGERAWWMGRRLRRGRLHPVGLGRALCHLARRRASLRAACIRGMHDTVVAHAQPGLSPAVAHSGVAIAEQRPERQPAQGVAPPGPHPGPTGSGQREAGPRLRGRVAFLPRPGGGTRGRGRSRGGAAASPLVRRCPRGGPPQAGAAGLDEPSSQEGPCPLLRRSADSRSGGQGSAGRGGTRRRRAEGPAADRRGGSPSSSRAVVATEPRRRRRRRDSGGGGAAGVELGRRPRCGPRNQRGPAPHGGPPRAAHGGERRGASCPVHAATAAAILRGSGYAGHRQTHRSAHGGAAPGQSQGRAQRTEQSYSGAAKLRRGRAYGPVTPEEQPCLAQRAAQRARQCCVATAQQITRPLGEARRVAPAL